MSKNLFIFVVGDKIKKFNRADMIFAMTDLTMAEMTAMGWQMTRREATKDAEHWLNQPLHLWPEYFRQHFGLIEDAAAA